MADNRSKNFAKWFGNSKLVDKNGKPMVLYHGTDRDFSTFDIRKHGASDHGWYGVGHYLTANPERGSVYSSYRGDTEALMGKKLHPGANVMPVHARLENPYIWPEDRPAATNMEEAIEITKKLIRMGYDGVIAPNYYDDSPYASHDEVVVFRPHQIKSAIGNSGDYDPNDPDITKAEGGGITAYHGSPHDFDQFDISKVGSGDGAQAYGHGLYFAANEPTAIKYRDYLSKDAALKQASDSGDLAKPEWKAATIVDQYGSEEKAIAALKDAVSRGYTHNQDYIDAIESGRHKQISIPKGHMYQVAIQAHPDHMLDWDKPLDQQPYIMQRLVDAGVMRPDGELTFMYNEAPARGGELYERLTSPLAAKLTGGSSQKHASEFLHSIGIKGIKYLDSGPRSVGKGSNNYVVFNHDLVGIKRKYARGGIVNA